MTSDPSPTASPSTGGAGVSGEAGCVLILDDSRANRLLLKRFTNDLGYEVREADNGLSGIDCLKNIKHLRLLLVDWEMPKMNGIDFIRTVRQTPSMESVPIIMVTSRNSVKDVRLALEAGANEFIMKPFTKEDLLSKMEMVGIHQATS